MSVATDDAPPHLGGHGGYTNTDEGVLDALVAAYRPRTFLDIGCGPGGMLLAAEARGLRATGIDGDPTIDFGELDVIRHDFTSGPAPGLATYDLGWSVEFLEHVEERFLGNVAPAFQACRRVWITHAVPGQHGHHHVNCQTAQYWANVFHRWGFRLNRWISGELRRESTMIEDYARRTGLFFTRAP